MKFLKSETGAFGIKEIAAVVAVIVVIGLIITVVRTNIGNWIAQVWNMFIDAIEDLIK